MTSWRNTVLGYNGLSKYEQDEFLEEYFEYCRKNIFDPEKLLKFRILLRVETVNMNDNIFLLLNKLISSCLKKYCSIPRTEEEMLNFIKQLFCKQKERLEKNKYNLRTREEISSFVLQSFI